jgi:TonB-dependent SusC/RagA subfamily outer membrane receptor
VVVTALGIKKEKKSLGYAVTEVKGGDLTEARSVNLANGLEGKVAGLNISPPATGANGSTRITIRGSGSISGNNQPLIVVDGVPINNDPSTLGPIVSWTKGDAQGYDKGDGISQLNPDEIETVSVLKGATAAALYGSRASNGAILITSKSAKAGQGVGVELGLNAAMETLLIPDLGYQTQYGHGTGGVKPATLRRQKPAVLAGAASWMAPTRCFTMAFCARTLRRIITMAIFTKPAKTSPAMLP